MQMEQTSERRRTDESMHAFIGRIINETGPRPPGSAAEQRAAAIIRAEMEKHTDGPAEVEPFLFAPHAFLGGLKPWFLLMALGVALFWLVPWASLVVSLIASVLVIGQVCFYYEWLDRFSALTSSQNVFGEIAPQGPARATVIVAGHVDSAYEYRPWYRLGELGVILMGVAALNAIAFNVLAALRTLAPLWNGQEAGYLFWWGVVATILTPLGLLFFFLHGKRAVDGACDNLAGVAITLGLAKKLHDAKTRGEGLKQTRVRFMAFGSEEAGLRGSRRYVQRHLEELRREKAILFNIDGVRQLSRLSITKGEVGIGVMHNPDLVAAATAAMGQAKLKPASTYIPIGATDAAAFTLAGLPAVNMVGMRTYTHDPTYHTRRDVLENVEPQALEASLELVSALILDLDRRETLPASWWPEKHRSSFLRWTYRPRSKNGARERGVLLCRARRAVES